MAASEPVNAVQTNLAYRQPTFDFVSITSYMAFSITAQVPSGSGIVLKVMGLPYPRFPGSQLVASVKFRPK